MICIELCRLKTRSAPEGALVEVSYAWRSGLCRVLNPLPPCSFELAHCHCPQRQGGAELQRGYAFNAARTRSGVIGYSRMRTPVASKNALAIAPTAAPITSSPA